MRQSPWIVGAILAVAWASTDVAGAGAADGPADRIPDGATVEVQGEYRTGSGLDAEEIEVRAASSDEFEFRTAVERIDAGARSIEVLGAAIILAADCELKMADGTPLTLDALRPGSWVEIDGAYDGTGRVAHRVRLLPEPSAQAEVEGPVTGRARNGKTITVAGLTVHLKRDTELQGDLLPVRRQVELVTSIDDDDARPATLRLAEGRLLVGGVLEWSVKPEQNLDLMPARRTDVIDSDWNGDLEATFRPTADVLAFAKGGVAGTWVLRDQQNEKLSESRVSLDQGYLAWRPSWLPIVALQVGRQDFDEPREWLYDENLDGVRLHAQLGATRAEASVSTRWDTRSRALREWRNEMLVAHGEFVPEWTTGAYAIRRERMGDAGNRATWYGLRSFGRVTSGLKHWLEVGRLDGTLDGVATDAWAIDAGARFRLTRQSRVTLSAGFAQGSGGNQPGQAYRQTGFQDNNDKLGGVASFKYYGELLEPELSNLRVLTGAVGFRPTRESSVDLIYHRYAQVEPLAVLNGTNLRTRPLGVDAGIGSEWDLEVAWEELTRMDLEYVFAVFLPGDAFAGSARPAYMNRLEVRYKF